MTRLQLNPRKGLQSLQEECGSIRKWNATVKNMLTVLHKELKVLTAKGRYLKLENTTLQRDFDI